MKVRGSVIRSLICERTVKSELGISLVIADGVFSMSRNSSYTCTLIDDMADFRSTSILKCTPSLICAYSSQYLTSIELLVNERSLSSSIAGDEM